MGKHIAVHIRSLILVLFTLGCTTTDPAINALNLIKNYDKGDDKELLVDSLLLLNNEWEIYNSYLENFDLKPLENKNDVDKLDFFVVPVLDLSAEALQYDYSQNILQYLIPLDPRWYENYKSFVFYDGHLIGALHANKKPNQSWELWDTTPFKEEQTYLTKIINKHRDSFFFCQTILAFCYIEDNQLYACKLKGDKSVPIEEFFEGYFTIKELKNRIRMREESLGAKSKEAAKGR